MNASAIAAIVIAGMTGITLICGMIAWFYRRGGQEKELTIAMRDTAEAVRELSAKFDAFGQTHKALEDRVDDHETRISVIEATQHR